MEATKPAFQKYILVCENKRETGDCCAPAGEKIRELLKNKIKEKKLNTKIRVSRTGCLDVCKWGPNVLIMPDNIWLKGVREEDLDDIVQRACEGLH
ncbi:MAG: (2Fe-2S) ferredoxin domain-containing protein [Deltaproteobacteria bacterium]|nr:(2Fe-2S) ferredoxin domain-containing protein [Deltaproteobacteria bacterium]